MAHSASGTISEIAKHLAPTLNARAIERLTTLEQSLDHLPIGVSVYDDELRLMTWNRTVVEIMAAPAGLFRDGMPMGDDGTVVGVSGVAHDVTERLRSEQALAEQRDELARLNGQQNRLFSIIGHDLRTPFNNLLDFQRFSPTMPRP